jgi:hypothetical protein
MTGIEQHPTESGNTSMEEKVRLIRFRMSKERFRFSEEIRLIPRDIVLLVVALFVLAQAIVQGILTVTDKLPWPELSRSMAHLAGAVLVTAVAAFVAAFIFLVAYVNRDAHRRGMNSTLWTVLVLVLLPAYFVTGFIIYFLLREPLPYPCPQCHAEVSARFNYCPECKHNLRPACPNCRREVRPGDRYCPHCAMDLSKTAQS